MELISKELKKNVNIHYLKTDKFKTTVLSFFVRRPLKKEEVTMNTLLSMVLKRGCPLYPKSQELSRKLDILYGSAFDTGISKKGNEHIVNVSWSYVNDKFIMGEEKVEEEILEIAKSLIFNQEMFDSDYVNQEKENLKNLISAQKNDKRTYAAIRLIEEMCKGEPRSINRLGYIEDVDKITVESLFEYYKNEFLKSPVDVFVCGEVNIDVLHNNLLSVFDGINSVTSEKSEIGLKVTATDVNNVVEYDKIVQGKLSMGFTTSVGIHDDDYPATVVFNAVFGGGVSSKLFNNVREKLSLCYYASSAIDYLSGIMTVNSGIEVKNYKVAHDEILVQLDDIRKGNVTDDELEFAKLSLINMYKSAGDSANALQTYYLSGLISGSKKSIDEMIDLVGKVTKQEVINVAKKVVLDTVYFMRGTEEE